MRKREPRIIRLITACKCEREMDAIGEPHDRDIVVPLSNPVRLDRTFREWPSEAEDRKRVFRFEGEDNLGRWVYREVLD